MDGIETQEPGAPHDHDHCIATALDAAELLCRQKGVRLTRTRRRVLEIVWESHRAVKAYDVLARLGENGREAKPPTVYRALSFLLEQGLIHRIERLNAFIGCSRPDHQHTGCFLICDACEAITEVPAQKLDQIMRREAEAFGFNIDSQTVEIFGQCSVCSAN